MMRVLLSVAAAALLGIGCVQRPSGVVGPPADSARALGDSVMVPVPAETLPDLVSLGVLELSGGARMGTVTVGEAALMRAENAEQQAAARRAMTSGMYLAAPYPVLYFSPSTGTDAVAEYVNEYPVGTPISVEMLVRLVGEGQAPTLRFEHAPAGAGAGDDGGQRRVPSAVTFELLPANSGVGYDRARILLGSGAEWSEQPEAPLPAVDWREFAHRIGLVIARDHVGLVVDGIAVIEAPVRLQGPPARPRARAVGGAAGVSVVVLQWTSQVEAVE
jgi:hypothetical protein